MCECVYVGWSRDMVECEESKLQIIFVEATY